VGNTARANSFSGDDGKREQGSNNLANSLSFEKQALLCKHDHRQRTRQWRSGVSDNIQQKIEFISEKQATFAVEIAQMKEVQRQQAASSDRLTENMHQTREMLHDVIGEMREGFNNLIIANEVTRKLAEDVGRLA
jgi:hypothetical protein